VHDLHAVMMLSAGFGGAFRALAPSMLNKDYEELEATYAVQSRLQRRASILNDSRSCTYRAAPFYCRLALFDASVGGYGGGTDGASPAASGMQHSYCSIGSSNTFAAAAANALLGFAPHLPMECTMEYLADLVKEKKQLEISQRVVYADAIGKTCSATALVCCRWYRRARSAPPS
ncbi:hypothetical protein PFISCL1PPCAC_25288, partial [Pristionchus fissidentatus]